MFRLDGRVALVTGSTRGIGFAIAQTLAAAGAHVVVNGRSADAVSARVGELQELGRAASGAAFDVTDVDTARSALDEVAAVAGRLDILVNNAGIQHRAALADFDQDAFDMVLGANLRAPFALAQAAAAHVVRSSWGRIINTGSLMGQIARPGIVAYVTSKTGVVGLTRALAVELAPAGVTVNAIGPGYIATEMNAALLADAQFTKMVERRTPAARWGRPEEVAAAALFLGIRGGVVRHRADAAGRRRAVRGALSPAPRRGAAPKAWRRMREVAPVSGQSGLTHSISAPIRPEPGFPPRFPPGFRGSGSAVDDPAPDSPAGDFERLLVSWAAIVGPSLHVGLVLGVGVVDQEAAHVDFPFVRSGPVDRM